MAGDSRESRPAQINERDVIVIGAGMAGLAAAIHAAHRGAMVLILERNNCAGKKILASGSGQCNVTHTGTTSDFLSHYGAKGKFLSHALHSFPNSYLIGFFRSRGVALETEENGKVFPSSRDARRIRDTLVAACAEKGVELAFGKKVASIAASDGFAIGCGEETYSSRFVVIATGGCSYPATGSDGSGYALAASLGHTIESPVPSLTPVFSSDFALTGLAGTSIPDALLSIWRHGRKVRDFSGDLLITHEGLSGPGILDHSRYMEAGDTIEISFVTEERMRGVEAFLTNPAPGTGDKNVKSVIASHVKTKRIAELLLEKSGIDGETKVSQLSKEKRKALARNASRFPVTISRCGGFDIAFATRGGVATTEIRSRSMESTLSQGLYFGGEVIDYDGDTGGYNLQAAFSTGALAGSAIRKALE